MFRKSTAADCRAIYDLICDMESTALTYDKFTAIYMEQQKSASYYCLIYEADGKVCGALNLRFEEQLHHAARIAEIMEFAIAPGCRSRGIGKAMLAKAIEIAKTHGCVQLEVACNQLRHDTHRFYQREGMHNFHFKFSLPLNGKSSAENKLGR